MESLNSQRSLSVIYPPNRPMERRVDISKGPVLYDNFLFIDINDRGETIAACSNIAGTYWEGTVFYYEDACAAQESNCTSFYNSSSSIADGKFFNNCNNVLIAEDTGHLKLLTVAKGTNMKCEDYFDNNDRIEQLAIWDQSFKVVVCSGLSITIWDMQSSAIVNPINDYRNYHSSFVTSVDTNYYEENIFVSAAMDRRVYIWDIRRESPASVLYNNEFSCLTSVAWNPSRSEYVAVGSNAGDIYLLDCRQPKELVFVKHCFDSSIHRLSYSRNAKLAVCGDLPEVQVVNDDFIMIYKETKHKGIVRGIAWFEESLYSCGFDRNIVKHTL